MKQPEFPIQPKIKPFLPALPPLPGFCLSFCLLSGLFFGLSATSHTARAQTLDSALICKEPAHAFISQLIDQHLIEAHPMRVESNSINAFWPTRGQTLTAYGFTVFAIVGFQQDDPIFRHGSDSKPIARSAYGAVVYGSESKVQHALDAAGSKAIAHHAGPFLTAIFCEQD